MDETWTITKADEEKINSLTTICYRKILGIDQVVDRISNEELLRRVNATWHVYRSVFGGAKKATIKSGTEIKEIKEFHGP